MLFFDETCTNEGVEHGDTITLPDGETMPVQVTSFAATYGDDAKPFLTMALPPVWRKVPRHASNPKLDRLMRAVFVHEMTHTRQSSVMGTRIGELIKQHHLPEDITDDVVQDRFGDNAAFRAAYERERDLFYAAAKNKDRKLAKQALAAMTARRAKFFRGDNAVYAELEDLFLNMEGVANWAGWFEAKREGEEDPTTFMRGSKKKWSQDEGLAIFLVLDALLPNWQQRVFAERPASVIDLLKAAVSS